MYTHHYALVQYVIYHTFDDSVCYLHKYSYLPMFIHYISIFILHYFIILINSKDKRKSNHKILHIEDFNFNEDEDDKINNQNYGPKLQELRIYDSIFSADY